MHHLPILLLPKVGLLDAVEAMLALHVKIREVAEFGWTTFVLKHMGRIPIAAFHDVKSIQ